VLVGVGQFTKPVDDPAFPGMSPHETQRDLIVNSALSKQS
jgi:hypothetical protein